MSLFLCIFDSCFLKFLLYISILYYHYCGEQRLLLKFHVIDLDLGKNSETSMYNVFEVN